MLFILLFISVLCLLTCSYEIILILLEYLSIILLFIFLSSNYITVSWILTTISFTLIFESVLFSCLVMLNEH